MAAGGGLVGIYTDLVRERVLQVARACRYGACRNDRDWNEHQVRPAMIMSGVQPVDPDLFRAHASNIGVLRALLGEVRVAGEPLGQAEAAFGPTCGWILTGLSDRYASHHDDIVYLEETLRIVADGLHRVADGKQDLKELIRRDDDVATTDGTRSSSSRRTRCTGSWTP